jgi:hypothetical protein
MTARDPLTLLEQNEAFQLILLGGLPGSGKSFYLAALMKRGWQNFDDFQSKTPNDSTDFRDSRQFAELMAALKAGERCVVADIRVIHGEYRESALRALRGEIEASRLQFQIFENQPEICSRNVERDPDRRLECRIRAITSGQLTVFLCLYDALVPAIHGRSAAGQSSGWRGGAAGAGFDRKPRIAFGRDSSDDGARTDPGANP